MREIRRHMVSASQDLRGGQARTRIVPQTYVQIDSLCSLHSLSHEYDAIFRIQYHDRDETSEMISSASTFRVLVRPSSSILKQLIGSVIPNANFAVLSFLSHEPHEVRGRERELFSTLLVNSFRLSLPAYEPYSR